MSFLSLAAGAKSRELKVRNEKVRDTNMYLSTNLIIVDYGRKISHSRYVFTFKLPPCQDPGNEYRGS